MQQHDDSRADPPAQWRRIKKNRWREQCDIRKKNVGFGCRQLQAQQLQNNHATTKKHEAPLTCRCLQCCRASVATSATNFCVAIATILILATKTAAKQQKQHRAQSAHSAHSCQQGKSKRCNLNALDEATITAKPHALFNLHTLVCCVEPVFHKVELDSSSWNGRRHPRPGGGENVRSDGCVSELPYCWFLVTTHNQRLPKGG